MSNQGWLYVLLVLIWISAFIGGISVAQRKIAAPGGFAPAGTIVALRGDLLLIRAIKPFNNEQLTAIHKYFSASLGASGLRVLILPAELEIVGALHDDRIHADANPFPLQNPG